MMCSGLAVDYAFMQSTRTSLQIALDAAAIAGAKAAVSGSATERASWDTVARSTFEANLAGHDKSSVVTFTPTKTADIVQTAATARVDLVFSRLFRSEYVDVDAVAEVPISGASSLEVALVLDNTGSMGQLNKMTELKAAATDFIDTLKGASDSGLGSVKIGLVPFTTQVRIATSYSGQFWMRFDPSSYEQKLRVSSYTWQGCIADRDQPNNARTPKPVAGGNATLFPGAVCDQNLSRVVPLTNDFAGLKSAVTAMVANGNTNTTIGLAWGYNILSPGYPLGDVAKAYTDTKNRKSIIMLTDGMNTADRWNNGQSIIDTAMRSMCGEVKKTDVTIYTIRLIDGNASLLQDCASDTAKYYYVKSATELKPVFARIAADLLRLRLSR